MINTEKKKQIIESFQQNTQDTGSTEVQLGLLTERITSLTAHCTKHSKDNSTRRGLLNMVSLRKKLLKYLKEKVSPSVYAGIIEKLGLRK